MLDRPPPLGPKGINKGGTAFGYTNRQLLMKTWCFLAILRSSFRHTEGSENGKVQKVSPKGINKGRLPLDTQINHF